MTDVEQKRLEKQGKKARKRARKEKKKRMAALSFEGEEEFLKVRKSSKAIMKNPEVDTSFLPDNEREQRDLAERERLRKELLEITYSYWDGTGHRRMVQCKKGDTIATFLEL